ncbi:conserved membrane hypothetical protein [uncultured spirochete]|uniref:TRAP C4-dicarboxylate transport system permease DctM subunit domain-containing protein n=1 Tax=uncultured spirochete TaxID=156406 RepID=A0A3P3XN06_9SPIR|nr:conserved membrane hypothetical protein [uncultured spirochete]
MEIIWILALMLFFIFIRVPIAFAIGLTGVISIIIKGLPLELVTQRMFTSLDSFTLLAVPLFIFVGEAMNTGGVTERLFGFCRVLLRHVKGSLGHVNVLASVIFAGMSGSAVADAAGLGIVEIKAMREIGFDDDFSAAVTAASSTIGPIIPPSIPMVIYAVLAEQSVGRLFLGGIVPGLLMAIALMILVYFISKKRNYPVEPRAKFGEIVRSFLKAFPSLLTPAIILGGILLGIISTTEAAALSAVYALFLGFVIHKELTLKSLYEILKRTVISSVTVLIVISSANILTWIIISSGSPDAIAALVQNITTNKLLVLLLINLVLLFMGCFLESISILTIMVPILLPIVNALGINLVAFGVIIVLNTMIGLITPPFGLSLFVVSKLTNLSVSKLTKPVLLFAIPLVVVLLLITIFPEVITFLPDLIMGKA